MKTVVLGLFDDLDDARRVLGQLVATPLDLGAVEVVRRDVASQAELTAEAGLRARRGPWAAILAGALLGATAGALAGQGPLASLGPLLAMAAGLIAGALIGVAMASISDTLRVPSVHADEMLAAVEDGATAIVVRTDNLPTARAIGDLFRACGSRELAHLEAAAGDGEGEPGGQEPTMAAAPLPERAAEADASRAPGGGGDALFAPPWRRGVPQPDVEPPPYASGPAPRPATYAPAESAGPVTAPSPVRFAPLPSAAPPAPAESPRTPSPAPERTPSEPRAPGLAAAPAPPKPPSAVEGISPAPEGVTLADDADIIVLGLAARHARALRDAGIGTVGALAGSLARVEDGALAIPGIGPAGARAIRERLDASGVPRPVRSLAPGQPPAERATDVRRLLREAIRDVRAERE